MESQDIKPRQPQDEHIVENKELNIWEALIPVIALIIMLFFNVFYAFGDDALSGSNQFILLLGAAVAAVVGGRVGRCALALDEVADHQVIAQRLRRVGVQTQRENGEVPGLVLFGRQRVQVRAGAEGDMATTLQLRHCTSSND